MSRKSEIKVYLPPRLVGELEGRKRMGTRSLFIQRAIDSYLRKTEKLGLEEMNPIVLLCWCRDVYSDKPLVRDTLQAIINEVNKK
jgi:metal-responsive CopG/Arc/MetJ family transcriptional regulator